MRRPRGFTLIEILAAVALLVILAATCVPLMRDISRAVPVDVDTSSEASVDSADLAQLADLFVSDHAAFDAPAPADLTDLRIGWPDHPSRPAVRVTARRADASSAEVDHCWLQFSCDGYSVHRWVRITEAHTAEASEEPAG